MTATDDFVAAPRSARLPGLEALRWIAALCVLLLHAEVIFGLPRVFRQGYLGVDVFFMLSGWVMARSFAGRPPAAATGAQPVGTFIVDRYLRVWPMMALGGLIGLPLLHGRTHDRARFLGLASANLALLPVWFQHQTYPLNVPAWTISFILLGNVLHRLVLFRLRGPALALAVAVIAVAMGAVAGHAGSFDVGARPDNVVLALPRLLLGYLIGIALWQGWGNKPAVPVPPLPALAAMPLLLSVAWWCGVTSWRFDMGFVVIACPLIIAGALRLQTGRSAISAAWLSFAGAWSFPLYAIHFSLLIRLRNHGFAAWQAVVIVLMLSALVTWLELLLRARLKRAGSWRAMIVGSRRIA